MFQHNAQQLRDLAAQTLQLARENGATDAVVDLSESLGQNVQVRLQEIEKIEFQQDKSLNITVYVGQRSGSASTADLSPSALKNTVQAALNIARYTEEDDCKGLPDADLLAKDCPDLGIYHEREWSIEQALDVAKQCEQAALDYDSRIHNSEGADMDSTHMQFVLANTRGFMQHMRGTRYSLSCCVVASDSQGMERDYWSDMDCDYRRLESPESIGRRAAEDTVKRLGSRPIKTGVYPVMFDQNISARLMHNLVAALSGGALYRNNSFLINSLGEKIFPDFVNLREEPHLYGTLGSVYFDQEGVATQPRFVIENGVVQGYFLGSYTARKLGMKSTANAGGSHFLKLNHTVETKAELLRQMGTGLLVTDLLGNGVNILTGDYSRGVAGFWVENGVIAYPVSEITIAGNLREMFASIQGIANDSVSKSSDIGSILLEKMTVAGT